MIGMKKLALLCCVAASFGAAGAQAKPIVVKGTANPYLAGQPSGTTCCSGDTAPDESPTLALSGLSAGETLTFKATGGFNYQGGAVAPTADGFTSEPFSMTADYNTGVSGPANTFTAGLVGVFTDGTQPSGTAPAPLQNTVSFKKLAPGLNQIFWIGDGLTGTGTGARQKFTVPAGATTLYLGSSDGSGWYDNVGTVKVTIKVIPAPGVH